MELRHLYLSPAHNYFGHHGDAAGTAPMLEVQEMELVAGSGIRGDRFFDYKKDYKGQVTFFSYEVWEALCRQLHVQDRDPSVFRRNLISSGVDLNQLIGKEFAVQGIRFLGISECSPCYWMDQAFAPGAEAALKGNGGLRAKILDSGVLKVPDPADPIPVNPVLPNPGSGVADN